MDFTQAKAKSRRPRIILAADTAAVVINNYTSEQQSRVGTSGVWAGEKIS